MESDYERLVWELHQQGFRVWFSAKGWTNIYHDGILVAVLWGSDDISVRHTIHRMRRVGFIWPPPKRD
jgi:hypothetical protein